MNFLDNLGITGIISTVSDFFNEISSVFKSIFDFIFGIFAFLYYMISSVLEQIMGSLF